MKKLPKCECTCDECGAECEPFYKQKEVKHITDELKKQTLKRLKRILGKAALDCKCCAYKYCPGQPYIERCYKGTLEWLLHGDK